VNAGGGFTFRFLKLTKYFIKINAKYPLTRKNSAPILQRLKSYVLANVIGTVFPFVSNILRGSIGRING
jgi:hypothetical protein